MRAADFVAKWRADAPGHELNERAGAQTHQTLDASVAAAYGFADYTPAMPDDEILRRLLALNLARSAPPQAPSGSASA